MTPSSSQSSQPRRFFNQKAQWIFIVAFVCSWFFLLKNYTIEEKLILKNKDETFGVSNATPLHKGSKTTNASSMYIPVIKGGAGGVGTATSGKMFKGNVIRHFDSSRIRFFNNKRLKPAKIAKTSKYTCKYWSVVTTIFEPSDAVRKQADLGKDWCIVIVGDKKSPKKYQVNSPNPNQVVYLDANAQVKYGKEYSYLSTFMNSLRWNHFGRKNVGFLYAIQQGAQAIWDFDDDNIVKKGKSIRIPQDDEDFTFFLPKDHKFPTYNPYVKLGAPYLPSWPRGLPLEHIKQSKSYDTPLVPVTVKGRNVGLIQSLADHDPDMDALYRLIMPLPFTFKSSAKMKPILLPKYTLAPLNAQACLFKRSAFFMLLLPITVHGRVSDIWRGYAGQRLLWDAGLQLAFSPSLVEQFRNPHSYLGDLDAEIPLYERSGVLVNFLRSWKGTSNNFAGRVEELYIALYNRGYIEIQDVTLMQNWIQALADVGYEFPELKSRIPPTQGNQKFPIQAGIGTLKQKDTSKVSIFDSLELMIPIPPIASAKEELTSCLYQSLDFFWPKKDLNILYMTDKEAPNAQSFSQELVTLTAPIANNVRVDVNEMPYNMKGHDRQQWLMFWADNFTSAEYIGFIDTDTVFTVPILDHDLFVNGRPRVNAVYGEPYNSFWAKTPDATFKATGIKEKFKAMTYFPVVLKTAHLKTIRKHIVNNMKAPYFDAAFKTSLTNNPVYSQFNWMLNIVYETNHDEYVWHIAERKLGWTSPVPAGQIQSIKEINASDLEPYPRIAVHWTWEKFGKLKGSAAKEKMANIMKTGYCYGQKTGTQLPAFCENIDTKGKVNPYMWVFEGDDYSSRPNTKAAQLRRQTFIDKSPNHPWKQRLVQKYFASR